MRISFRLLAAGLLLATAGLPACRGDSSDRKKKKGPPPTVGVLQKKKGAFDGYTLFSPQTSTETYLIDLKGRLVHTWSSAHPPGNSVYLLPGGNLLRCARPPVPPGVPFRAGGGAGRVEELDWDGNLVWEYELMNMQARLHHDIEPLPNGNVLMIAWELRTSAEAIAAGRNPAWLPGGEIWPDMVIEVMPTGPSGGSVVWEWHAWDHLVQDFDAGQANFGVVADEPGKIDVNFQWQQGADWLHTNAIDYDPGLDQILLSVPTFDEIWVIDHGTTTAEAATSSGGARGRGGEILYRWGNPLAHGAGIAADQMLFGQHDSQWIEPGLPGAGNILVFNNGTGRPGGPFSSVDEIVTTADPAGDYPIPAPGSPHGPAAPTWSYVAPVPGDFYGAFISGAQRQPNGNTLVCEGPSGRFFEVSDSGELVWEYLNPVTNVGITPQGQALLGPNSVFRAPRYPPGHPGLDGRDLTPGDPIEGN